MTSSDLAHAIRLTLKRLAYGGGTSRVERERVVDWLGLEPGMRIADIGAGFGAFAFDFARAVGPTGLVYAVDTDADLRGAVEREAAEHGLANVRPVEAQADTAGLPEPVDIAFLSKSYHHLSDRAAYVARLRADLRPGGRVAILELRPGVFLRLPGHSVRPADVRATMGSAGYRFLDSTDAVSGATVQVFALAT